MNSELVNKIINSLIEIIKENIDDINNEITENTSLEIGGLDFDSLQLVVFIGATEDYFGIEFNFDILDEDKDSLSSILTFAEIIEEYYHDKVEEKYQEN